MSFMRPLLGEPAVAASALQVRRLCRVLRIEQVPEGSWAGTWASTLAHSTEEAKVTPAVTFAACRGAGTLQWSRHVSLLQQMSVGQSTRTFVSLGRACVEIREGHNTSCNRLLGSDRLSQSASGQGVQPLAHLVAFSISAARQARSAFPK